MLVFSINMLVFRIDMLVFRINMIVFRINMLVFRINMLVFRINMLGLGETVVICDPEDVKQMYRYSSIVNVHAPFSSTCTGTAL